MITENLQIPLSKMNLTGEFHLEEKMGSPNAVAPVGLTIAVFTLVILIALWIVYTLQVGYTNTNGIAYRLQVLTASVSTAKIYSGGNILVLANTVGSADMAATMQSGTSGNWVDFKNTGTGLLTVTTPGTVLNGDTETTVILAPGDYARIVYLDKNRLVRL